jgi:hypothetical protein
MFRFPRLRDKWVALPRINRHPRRYLEEEEKEKRPLTSPVLDLPDLPDLRQFPAPSQSATGASRSLRTGMR